MPATARKSWDDGERREYFFLAAKQRRLLHEPCGTRIHQICDRDCHSHGHGVGSRCTYPYSSRSGRKRCTRRAWDHWMASSSLSLVKFGAPKVTRPAAHTKSHWTLPRVTRRGQENERTSESFRTGNTATRIVTARPRFHCRLRHYCSRRPTRWHIQSP